MRVLVTTSFSLLELDVDSGEFRRVLTGEGLYYGLAKAAGLVYVAARGRLVSSDVAPDLEQGRIVVLDSMLNLVDRLSAPFPLRDLHQIYWDKTNLLATCAFDNMIAVFDGDRWDQWYPLGKPEGASSDINHFNSIARFREGLCLVAHNRGPSDLLFFDDVGMPFWSSLRLGSQAHNVWKAQGQWMTCSSIEGRIVGDAGFCVETGGFPRGILFGDDLILVGISELAERKDRDLTTGRILVYDRRWVLQRTILLPNEGLVLDILRP